MKKVSNKKVSVTKEQIKNAIYQFRFLSQNSKNLTKVDRFTVLILVLEMFEKLSITDIKTIQKLSDKYTNLLNK